MHHVARSLELFSEEFMAKSRLAIHVCVLLLLATGGAPAQTYPSRPVRIVTAAVGGGGDFISRLVGPRLSTAMGQPVIVDNRAGSITPNETVAKSTPDGYTLLLNSDALWMTALLQKTPYDPLADFAPIVILDKSPNVLVVNSGVSANSVKELIDLAKANPGKLNFATGPTGVPNHVSAELFKALANINIVRVAYAGGGPALNSVLAGETQILFGSAPTIAPHVKTGRIKAFAVTSAQRSQLVPDLPTLAAAGVLGYAMESIDAMYAPTGTPAAIITRLNQEAVRIVKSQEMTDRLFSAGVEVVGSTPEQLGAWMKTDFAKWEKVFRDAGISAK
jgi:tripartite-type tricarboxylate transporter receptor subunit TctC